CGRTASSLPAWPNPLTNERSAATSDTLVSHVSGTKNDEDMGSTAGLKGTFSYVATMVYLRLAPLDHLHLDVNRVNHIKSWIRKTITTSLETWLEGFFIWKRVVESSDFGHGEVAGSRVRSHGKSKLCSDFFCLSAFLAVMP